MPQEHSTGAGSELRLGLGLGMYEDEDKVWRQGSTSEESGEGESK
jgi:hypothetical protein